MCIYIYIYIYVYLYILQFIHSFIHSTRMKDTLGNYQVMLLRGMLIKDAVRSAWIPL